VLTDSGGIQEETILLKVPCITLCENTERPVTVDIGTNHVVGTDADTIVRTYRTIIDGGQRQSDVPPLSDAKAAERIVEVLLQEI